MVFTRWGLNWCTQVSAICSPLAPALHNATSELYNAATALCNAMAILVSAGTILVSAATILISMVTVLVGSILHPHQQWPLLWLVVQRIFTLLYESPHQAVTLALIVTLRTEPSYYVMNHQKEEIVLKIPLVVWHPDNASCDINIDLYNAKTA